MFPFFDYKSICRSLKSLLTTRKNVQNHQRRTVGNHVDGPDCTFMSTERRRSPHFQIRHAREGELEA